MHYNDLAFSPEQLGVSSPVIQNSTAAKPALDDESFTRLLEAAFILQEHQARTGQKTAPDEFPRIVHSILEIQRRTQSLQIDLPSALDMIASKLCEFTSAAGVAIGRIEQDKMHYLVGAGTAAVLADSSISVEATSSSQCVRTGKSVKSLATEADSRLNLVLCRKLGAKSFLAVPVFRNADVGGVVELFFPAMNAFGDIEIRTAELMAGVVAEVMTQQSENELKQELAAERASVLQVLEKLKPQLQKLAGEEPALAPTPLTTQIAGELCRACGQPFQENGGSCQHCGASRTTGKYPGTELQSKWAALWERQMLDTEHGPSFRRPVPQMKDADPILEADSDHETLLDDADEGLTTEDSSHEKHGETDLVLLHRSFDNLEESIPEPERPLRIEVSRLQQWQDRLKKVVTKRGGDVSLVLAGVVFLVAVSWGLWSKPARGAVPRTTNAVGMKRKPRPAAPPLTLLERTLVSLGLAVPPPAPEYLGNPNAQVWVDLQTGLYYCSGVPSYGSTPKGRYASQVEAQQDQFEPAARTPCE